MKNRLMRLCALLVVCMFIFTPIVQAAEMEINAGATDFIVKVSGMADDEAQRVMN